MFGVSTVLLGVFFLMKEMGLIQGEFWGYFWPLLLIVLGLNMMSKGKYNSNCFAFRCGNDKKHKHHSKHKHDKVVDDQ